MAKLYTFVVGFMAIGNLIEFLQLTHLIPGDYTILDPTNFSFAISTSLKEKEGLIIQQAMEFISYWVALEKLFLVGFALCTAILSNEPLVRCFAATLGSLTGITSMMLLLPQIEKAQSMGIFNGGKNNDKDPVQIMQVVMSCITPLLALSAILEFREYKNNKQSAKSIDNSKKET